MAERAVLVARVSSTGQDEDNQIPDLQAWSDGHGYEVPDGHVIKIHGKSAFHGHHKPELDKAVRMIEAGLADVIVMWALDRASRQGIDAAFRFRFAVQDAGGRVEFTEYPELNGGSQEAQRAWADFADDARRESEKRIRRISSGNRRTVDSGAAIRRPKYGYALAGSKRGKEWTVDESKATVVRGMYERAVNGDTLGVIALWAAAQDGGHWDASRARKILADTAYIGKAETRVNGDAYTYGCPAIVSVETWERANAAVKAPKRYVRAAVSPFAGIVLCGHCGTVMRRTSEGGGSHRVTSGRYWRCPQGCGNVRYDEFSGRVHNALSGIAAELLEEVIIKSDDMRQVRLTLLESELAGIGRKGLSPAGMITRINEISAEMEAVRAEKAPRGKIQRKGTGASVGEAYKALDHDDPAAVNAWLKKHNVRVWRGGQTAGIAVRESSRLGAEGQAAYAETGMVITWWLTEG
jgi:DNA invertase Pin-like site-specific DNA recombinase